MIEVEGLVKRHGSAEILRGVGLSVSRGEVAAIIGPSGSGKSTLLRCLNGLETFQAGSVVVDGLRVDSSSPTKAREACVRQVCRRVGMVFQAYHLFPHRSVLENVTEGPTYVLGMERAKAEERAECLLDRVGLRDRLSARPRELSGGQQQRVAIARALAMEPKVMLFDEPTSALDPRMTAEVLAVMADLARDGLTMVVVTHAMRFARRLASTVHVICDGLIVESGPPEQVFDAPRTEATRRLLAEVEAA
jgi:ABC-type polar amino acid transport system ATPase subunit